MRRYQFPLLLVCTGAVWMLTGCEEPARRVKGGGGNAVLPSNQPPPGRGGSGPQIGQMAPEIEGKDADGKPFKLSDYRGKVVVLDFWGEW